MTDDLNNINDSLAIMLDNYQTENSFFTINSQKASEILGVNRTRLSQLTSQGVFPYERRKVEARSRLFYRLNDILNYQRKSTFGNLPEQTNHLPAQTNNRNALVPLLPPASSSLVKADNKVPVLTVPKTALKRIKSKKFPRAMPKALDLKMRSIENTKNEKLSLQVSKIEKNVLKVEENILKLEENVKKIMSVILNLENSISKLGAQKLNAKKSVFHRPRLKRIFKIVKR